MIIILLKKQKGVKSEKYVGFKFIIHDNFINYLFLALLLLFKRSIFKIKTKTKLYYFIFFLFIKFLNMNMSICVM